MSTDIAESLPKRKFAPAAMAKSDKKAAAPAPKGGGKKGDKPAAKGGGKEKGASEEGSEKRIRQAVYDIRYRARREDIDLKAAFAQYMSNSSLSQADRTAVREKIFGKAGGVTEKFTVGADDWASDNVANALYQVFVERDKSEELQLAYLQQLDEDEAGKKYKVRVTDKNGRSYVRFADRAKITELRQNPNIESVEMTEHGDAYEGERRKGRLTARAKQGKKLDPVGKEDKDIDNDGDHDKTDKYLLKRRKAIGSAIRKRADKKIREAFLADGTVTTEPKNPTKITGKGVDNYSSGAVKISPDDGSQERKKAGVYAHLELGGNTLSESQRKLYEMMKKKEEEDKGKLDDMATKDSVKKDDEKKEEKPDTRGMYAKIAMIKNKLRSAGQRDPMVMAVDACEERTPAKDDPAFDKMRPGGSNSQYEKDGSKKRKKISGEFPGTTKEFDKKYGTGKKAPKKDTAPKKVKKDTAPKGEKYNPYPKAPKGSKQATPSNMVPGKP